jgi:hypothetical protein
MKTNTLLFELTILTAALLISGCSTISIRTAVEIDAPREKVYAVLADLESYPKWNPYHRRVEGDFEEGAELRIDVFRPDGKQVAVPPHMLRIINNEQITWGGGVRGIFYGVHSFILEPGSERKTLLKHNEDFSGLAIGFADLPPDVIADGYHQMNMALKAKVEEIEYSVINTTDNPVPVP